MCLIWFGCCFRVAKLLTTALMIICWAQCWELCCLELREKPGTLSSISHRGQCQHVTLLVFNMQEESLAISVLFCLYILYLVFQLASKTKFFLTVFHFTQILPLHIYNSVPMRQPMEQEKFFICSSDHIYYIKQNQKFCFSLQKKVFFVLFFS